MHQILILVVVTILACTHRVGAQGTRPWTVSIGLAETRGGDYNARGAFVAALGYEGHSLSRVAPFGALTLASAGILSGECTGFGEYCFRHFPAWTTLTGGAVARWANSIVDVGTRAGAGFVGYQEQDLPRSGGPAAGGYSLVGEVGVDVSGKASRHRIGPMVSCRAIIFRGPREAGLRVFMVGLGARF